MIDARLHFVSSDTRIVCLRSCGSGSLAEGAAIRDHVNADAILARLIDASMSTHSFVPSLPSARPTIRKQMSTRAGSRTRLVSAILLELPPRLTVCSRERHRDDDEPPPDH